VLNPEQLIDNSFEHSLVQELGYTGYERLPRGFDRAFGGQDKIPTFSLVFDAGCGTGLVGEHVRIELHRYTTAYFLKANSFHNMMTDLHNLCY
jgi:predicted TPR repeat methyltransferase